MSSIPFSPSFPADLSLYELHRKPHEMVSDNSAIAVSPRSLHSELMCPICLDLMRNTQTTKEVSPASLPPLLQTAKACNHILIFLQCMQYLFVASNLVFVEFNSYSVSNYIYSVFIDFVRSASLQLCVVGKSYAYKI